MQALEYWRRYQTTPTLTVYRREERSSFPAPKITICRTPSFRDDRKGPGKLIEGLDLSSFLDDFGLHPNEIFEECHIRSRYDFCSVKGGSQSDDLFHSEGKYVEASQHRFCDLPYTLSVSLNHEQRLKIMFKIKVKTTL